ncbi:Lysophospholipase L1 [Pseudorhodobacter antarcticus]|jgi:lysophospholipase L1-like esterase|uniref:Lysophospholipase L1 n=1 Tax=Pseudorhodobacter antarcticus TaxID=1077947 RepID=A0A1H8C9S4_9RHOB|nr:GDSL-type esterase/lipase family protein [Pseudorhodobacter antarcticus]SEM91981.1 Lysophospholipase L1 [Pseudorhodobacter antarcticus]
MPILLTYGDSNTHGTPPITTRGLYARYDAATRWPTRAAQTLGPDWQLVEEGLPGRTTAFNDPVMGDHMNGTMGLRIALNSHGPLTHMVLMLGTNDVKTRFGATPDRIMAGIAALVDMALAPDMALRHSGLKILLVAPPHVQEIGPLVAEFTGGAAKSRALGPLLATYANARNLGFLDAATILQTSPTDGIHFEPAGHAALATAIAVALKTL